MPAARWVDDGFGAGAWVCGYHLVDKAARGAVASGGGRLAGAEDVDFRAGLARLQGSGGRDGGERESCDGDLHGGNGAAVLGCC